MKLKEAIARIDKSAANKDDVHLDAVSNQKPKSKIMKVSTKTKNKSANTQMYEDAFMHHFKCKKEDYDFKHESTGGYFKFKKDGSSYKVLSNEDLRRYCEEKLTDEDEALFIPFPMLLEIAEDIHTDERFMLALMNKINTKELDVIIKALQLSGFYGSAEIFWMAISDELLPKCVTTIVEVFDKKCCVEELMGLYADERLGLEYLTELKDGIFASIKLDDNELSEDDEFLIFTVDMF